MNIKELENKYKDEIIETEIGKIKIYYTFRAGQVGWEKRFNDYINTEMNLKKAIEELKRTYGYMNRKSNIIAYKEVILLEEIINMEL